MAASWRPDWISTYDSPLEASGGIYQDAQFFPHPDGHGLILPLYRISHVKSDSSVEDLGPGVQGKAVGIDTQGNIVTYELIPRTDTTRLVIHRYQPNGIAAGASHSLVLSRVFGTYETQAILDAGNNLILLMGAAPRNQVLMKIDPAGKQLWSMENPAGTNKNDIATILKLAPDQGLILGGAANATVSAQTTSALLVKISPDGVRSWRNVQTKENPGVDQNARILALDFGTSGHIYTAGQVETVAPLEGPNGTVDVSKVLPVTTQYRNDGSIVWSKRFSRTDMRGSSLWGTIAVDAAGNIYSFTTTIDPSFTGGFPLSPQTRLTIIKYSPQGLEEWFRFSPDISFFVPLSAKVAGNGDVLVSASVVQSRHYSTSRFQRYTPTGTLLGSLELPGMIESLLACCSSYLTPTILEDGQGSTFITTASLFPFTDEQGPKPGKTNVAVVTRVNSSMKAMWSAPLPGRQDNPLDTGTQVWADANRNSYTLASTANDPFNWLLIKNDAQGSALWTNHLEINELRQSQFVDGVVNHQGGLDLVFSRSNGWLFASITASGQLTGYSSRFPSTSDPSPSWEKWTPLGLAVDPASKHTLMMSVTVTEGRRDDLEFVRFDETATPITTNRFDYTQNIVAVTPSCFDLDSGGNILVGGNIFSGPPGGQVYRAGVLKLDPQARLIWTRAVPEIPKVIFANGNGDIFTSSDNVFLGQLWTTKWNSDGDVLWADSIALNQVTTQKGVVLQNHRGVPVYVKNAAERSALLSSGLLVGYDVDRADLLLSAVNAMKPGTGTGYASAWWYGTGDVLTTGVGGANEALTVHFVEAPKVTQEGNNKIVEWLLEPDATYLIQRAVQAQGPWSDLGSTQADGAGNTRYRDNSGPLGQVFYRFVKQG